MSASFDRRRFLTSSGSALASLALASTPLRAEQKPMEDVIVLIPGITGSTLSKNGRDIWALSATGILGAVRSLGGSIDTLKLAQDPSDVDDLGDGVSADRLFDDVHLIPGFWKIDGYGKIRERIKREFEVEAGINFFEFPYDWRRDNRVAARRLARQSHVWLKAWRTRSGNADAKLVLLAHSMGGLVARYFAESLDGWRDIRKLITFGTPFRGSLNALNFLSNGYTPRVGSLELADLSALMRSFTSVYQLLPRYPCFDAGDGKLVRVGEIKGIPNVDAAKATNALEFHREIDAAVEVHLRDEAYLRNRYLIHPIVGTYQPTLQTAKLAGGKVELSAIYPGEQFDGDGTVPRVSATPLELSRADAELFVAQVHGSLQNTDAVLTQVAGLLTAGKLKWDKFREDPVAISLALQDVYSSSDPIAIVSRCEDPAQKLTAIIADAPTGAERARKALQIGADGNHAASFGPLPEGAYRVTVSGQGATTSVSDVFLVA